MLIGEVLVSTVGAAIGRALVKSWVGESELLTDVSVSTLDLLRAAGLDWRERRRVDRELAEITEQIGERLSSFFDAESYGGLPDNERRAVAYAVAAAINEGFTEPAVALAEDLDASRLEERLRKAGADARRRERISELAERLYDISLRESSAYLVQMLPNLPRFNSQAFAEVLARERRVVELLTEALENLPRADDERALDFETRYLRQVTHELDRLELFGFGAVGSRRYALSVAYITLTAAATERYDDRNDDYYDLDDVDAPSEDGEDVDEETRSARVDRIVGESARLLLRGDAGSGKTTLLQWLAVNAAKRSFMGRLKHLNGHIPFFVQLRRFVDTGLPSPEDFINRVAVVIRGEMPKGWVETQMDSGRALVLIDGVDELSSDRRDEVRSWLSALCLAYPSARYVVTSRPPAVDQEWLDGDGFDHGLLEPMNLSDVEAFIDHWYAAAVGEVSAHRRPALDNERDDLKRAVRRTPPLRRLATSPLLCAMLAALQRDGNASLPADRIELYRLALHALLERRDTQRRVQSPDRARLTLRQKQGLLQILAPWLVRNGYSDAPRDRAIQQIAAVLPRFDLNSSPEEVFEHLLQRTGLLREPIEGHIDFIHRTFLEYLAAEQIVEDDDLGMLLDHASEDTWAEIIVLATGVASSKQRALVLAGLLDRADESSHQDRHRLRLLAVSALDTAPELDPELRNRIASTLRSVVPPRTLTAAKLLASAGELAVPLLGARRPLMRAVEARACVRALGTIGSESALDQLAGFGFDSRLTVIRELLQQWPNFDKVVYAEKVLAASPLQAGRMSVGDGADLRFVPFLRQLSELTVRSADGELDVGSLVRSDQLAALTLYDATGIRDLGQLGSKPHLQRLRFLRCPDLESLRGISKMAGLRVLGLSHAPELEDLELLQEAQDRLMSFQLAQSGVADIDGLRFQKELRELRLALGPVSSLEPLADLTKLVEVTLGVSQDMSLFPLIESGELRWLTLSECQGELEFVPLARGGRRLASLAINDCPAVRLASAIAEIGPADEVVLRHVPMTSLEGLDPLDPVRLELSRVDVESLDGLPKSVRHLRIRNCENLTALSGIDRAHDLTDFEIYDCPELRDVTALAGLSNVNVTLRYPQRYWDSRAPTMTHEAAEGVVQLGAALESAGVTVTIGNVVRRQYWDYDRREGQLRSTGTTLQAIRRSGRLSDG